MTEYNNLLNNIRRYVDLTEEEAWQLTGIIQKKRVKKRQFIVQPGFVCQHRNYVEKGAFRLYYLDMDGKEHTVSIGVEDWFVSDFYSYITQTPATLYAEALEDSIIFQLPYEAIEDLCKKIHNLSEYFRRTTERAFAYSRRRVISNISQTAEERYAAYLEKYPHIASRVPQYILASYLGISAEFLSKIRSRKGKKS
ncbi:MAG: Crp/Fnr family transcriptional regulator [Bacteroidota bacterium]